MGLDTDMTGEPAKPSGAVFKWGRGGASRVEEYADLSESQPRSTRAEWAARPAESGGRRPARRGRRAAVARAGAAGGEAERSGPAELRPEALRRGDDRPRPSGGRDEPFRAS